MVSAGRHDLGACALHNETLTYEADGLRMRSQLFFEPGNARNPGVLVFPEAFGLSEHAVGKAEV